MAELAAAALVQRGITQLTGRSDSPRRDAEVLLQAACGIDRTALARNPDQPVDAAAADTYRYLNFDTLQSFADKAHSVHLSQEMIAAARKLQTSP